MAETTLRIRLSLASSLENVRLAGMCASGICRGLKINEDDAYEVELALCEAVNNAIRHAYKGEPSHLVEVEVEANKEILRFRVSDTGIAMDPARLNGKETDHPKGIEDMAYGGMGLGIIKNIMDSVEYTSNQGKNTFCLTKRFKN